MRNLVVPMAGGLSESQAAKPIWMATHPMTGRFVAIESILGLNLDWFERIVFVSLQSFEDTFHFARGFVEELKEHGLDRKAELLLLKSPTKSPVETVSLAVEQAQIQGFMFVKDADGFYNATITDDRNQVAYAKIEDIGEIDAGSKSYVELDLNGLLTNIVERKVISPHVSVGGYGFASADEFADCCSNLKKFTEAKYISQIIFELLLGGTIFYGLEATGFIDWGDATLWRRFCSKFKCLFLDLDGTLVTNSSAHFEPSIGSGAPLSRNIAAIRKMREQGTVKVVVTTSRPKRFYEQTVAELKEKGIPYDELVMGLPHCQRVVVNDFARSNTYPSCIAINVPRDSDSLVEYLQ